MAADNLQPFMQFVNYELPKRLSTETPPTSVSPGLIPVTTGVGLGVEFRLPTTVIPAGKSAYELAVENGFEGTVEEWLASLAGGDFRAQRIGLVTAKQLPLNSEGTVTLPNLPYGDVLHNLAIVHLRDGSVLEVTGVSVDDNGVLRFQPEDWLAIAEHAATVTVSYLGDLPQSQPQKTP